MITAKTIKLSACPCGFPALAENIPLGTEYHVDPASCRLFTLICGGCARRLRITGVYCHARAGSRPGYLPLEIFDIGEPGNALALWTIYDHPRDYPQGYVARRFDIKAGQALPTKLVIVADRLETLREQLPPGLICIPRDPDDDPVILENWI